MSWEKVSEHIDEAQGKHSIFFENNATQPVSRHQLHIHIGHTGCPFCGHVKLAEGVAELDVHGMVSQELEALEASTAQIKAHGRKHNVPKKRAR